MTASARDRLAVHLPTLEPTTVLVLKHRFGIGMPPRTREQTAVLMGLTTITVYALEHAGLRALRRKLGVNVQ